ncbi:MAG: LEA type 2 family protein [Gemmatimonadaceae bacterium]|nr:LEA type 2 family protein [Gemmatimonadaceae bacterium]
MSLGLRRLMVLGAVVLAALGGSSCASIARATLQDPVVTLRDVKVTGLGLQGGSLDVVLGVYNPNGLSLRAVRLTYNVAVDSAALATGQVPTETELAGNDTTIVRLPVSFTYRGVGAAVAQMMARGSVTYTVSGELGVRTPIGTVTRPYRRVGTYAMARP